MKEKINNATRFILPMLVKEVSFKKNDIFEPHHYIFFRRPTFVNTYLSDNNKPEYKDKILVKYHYDLLLDYPIFERKLEHLPTYVTDYSDDDGVVYVFDVPERWTQDYTSFKNGKYSELTTQYADQVKNFWDQDNSSTMVALFNNKKQKIINYLSDHHGIEDLDALNNPGELWFMPGNAEILNSLS